MEFCCEYMGGRKSFDRDRHCTGEGQRRRLIEKMRENEELQRQYEEIRGKLEAGWSIVND